MSRSTPPPTPEIQGRIVSFVRAGGYPHVAAEAAGVSRRLFQKWMRRGGYRGFAEDVRQAAAQARLRAEIAIFDKRPLDWLKSGPAKETSRQPGWSAASKARTAPRGRDGNPLADPACQQLLARLREALTPFPDARAALAEQIEDWPHSRRQ